MRSPRIVIALLALALTASMAFTSSATARVGYRPVTGAHQASARATTITARVVKRRVRPDGPRRLVFQGTVNPPKGPVYIQKATRCNRTAHTCNFKFYRKVFVRQGSYHAVIGAPRTLRSWLWRAKVGSTYSDIWQTCTKRPAQNCRIPY